MRARAFTLAAVALILAAAAGIAGLAMLAARGSALGAGAGAAAAELDAAMDGAVALFAADLFDEDAPPPRLDGAPRSYEVGRVEIKLHALSEAGRLDLNAAEPQLFEAVCVAAGAGPAAARSARTELEAFRRNGRRLVSVAEARGLFGAAAEDFHRCAPGLTIDGGGGQPDPRFAPAMVLEALPLPPGEATARLAARSTATGERLARGAAPTVALFLVAEGPGGARRLEERLIALDPAGVPALLERRPLDDATLARLFSADAAS
jgi:hypothetical protein